MAHYTDWLPATRDAQLAMALVWNAAILMETLLSGSSRNRRRGIFVLKKEIIMNKGCYTTGLALYPPSAAAFCGKPRCDYALADFEKWGAADAHKLREADVCAARTEDMPSGYQTSVTSAFQWQEAAYGKAAGYAAAYETSDGKRGSRTDAVSVIAA